MRSDRLLSALLLLQAHGQLSGRELSRRLEVSERTIHRDMESLSAAGVPVHALRGAQGGWQLDENWRTQVPGLSESELQGLLMAQPRAAGNPQLARSAERALEKLLAALPTPMRDRAASIRQRLYVDPTGWRSSDSLTALPIVQDALSLDRRIGFRYRRPGYPLHLQTERIVDPLGLIAKGNSWYLFAQTAKGTRTYAVSRIDSPRIADQPSHRPANFDLPAAWNASTDRYQQNLKRYTVTLLVEPSNSECCSLAAKLGSAGGRRRDWPPNGASQLAPSSHYLRPRGRGTLFCAGSWPAWARGGACRSSRKSGGRPGSGGKPNIYAGRVT